MNRRNGISAGSRAALAALVFAFLLGFASCNKAEGSAAANSCEAQCDPQPSPSPPSPPQGACITLDAPDAGAAAPIVVVTGTTDGGTFTELSPQEKLMIQFGAQGGQHVWITLRIFTKDPGTFAYNAQFDGQAGEMGAFGSCTGGQWVELVDIPVFLDDGNPGPRTLSVSVGPADKAPVTTITVPVELM
jgi:hypothetical protein